MSSTNDGREDICLLRSQSLVLVQDTPKGRGVFARARIPARTVVEVSPVLVFGVQENEAFVQRSRLVHYTYTWPTKSSEGVSGGRDDMASNEETRRHHARQTQAMPLGLGALFNHSSHPARRNVGWTRDVDREIITYVALRDVEAGEELCISYGPREKLTFVDVEAEEREEVEKQVDDGGDEIEIENLMRIGFEE